MKIKTILLSLLFIFNSQLFSQHEIVFVAEPGYCYQSWVQNAKDYWHATGICISLDWGMLDTNSYPSVDTWTPLDNAVTSISNVTGMDIYIRINFGTGKPSWVAPDNYTYMPGGIQNFQIKSNGEIYDYYDYTTESDPDSNPTNPGRRYPLNFASSTSKSRMTTFYHNVLDHIMGYSTAIKSKIKEVSPTFSHYQETEYPVHIMCGYSTHENSAFVSYLQDKYGNTSSGLEKLNQTWDPDDNWPAITWTNINPQNYNWDTPNNTPYTNGRADWIDFRTTLLAGLLKEFADLNVAHGGYKFGVQFGSIYDNGIDKRGWVDPTKLIEYADVVHVADTPLMVDNYDFGADYLRSICKFWSNTVQTGRSSTTTRTFTSESNAIEITGRSNLSTADCPDEWNDQIRDYYEKGASAHFICNWEFSDTNLITLSNNANFSTWENSLDYYSDRTMTSLPNDTLAIHLGCEYYLWNSNSWDGSVYDIQKSIKAESPYLSLSGSNWDDNGQKDIITNYMVERNPSYLTRYTTGVHFTRSSQYITSKAYLGFMKSSLSTIPYVNATMYYNGSRNVFAYTHGIKNEYYESRSPIHLIWRSRPDLISSFPTAGASSGEDFIYWVTNSGVIEYHDWDIYDSNNIYNYDNNLYKAWNEDCCIKNVFTDGHYYSGDPNWHLISWAKTTGYQYYSYLYDYNNWPYIGENTTLRKTNTESGSTDLPMEFDLKQNYPNPFNPTTIITYAIPTRGFVSIKVYDILGKEVATLINEAKDPGNYEVEFDGMNLSSGLYIYTLQSNNSVISRKMLLLK